MKGNHIHQNQTAIKSFMVEFSLFSIPKSKLQKKAMQNIVFIYAKRLGWP